MNFVEALREAKKLKCGLRPVRWRTPWEEYDGPVDLRGCAYTLRRYYRKTYLVLCASGTLRTVGDPHGTLFEGKDLLGEWELITEQELNAESHARWEFLRREMDDESSEGE